MEKAVYKLAQTTTISSEAVLLSDNENALSQLYIKKVYLANGWWINSFSCSKGTTVEQGGL